MEVRSVEVNGSEVARVSFEILNPAVEVSGDGLSVCGVRDI